ncbi:MAG: GspE/PulE family protein [Candidatus Dependentiae bacterium]
MQDRSVIQIVDALLHNAIERGASDIHLESCQDGLRVRLRIDGILYDHAFFDTMLMPQIISRIKVLAHIDIAQKRIPQDGKFQIADDERQIDLRISTFPTLFGQKMVIRILDPSEKTINIARLGMSSHVLSQFEQLLREPQGFFLVTGPTGSGKTTTLYAGLSHINTVDKNIITLEDPIEYHIEGITQGHIHPEAGFTFEKGMRSLLRQDPDIVMVGEIRDAQTARIAIQAAMTGHSVLSTLHTNDAPSVIMRLMDMGIEPFLINASLSGILAQRLVRLLCSACKTERNLTEKEQEFCDMHGIEMQTVCESQGCQDCFDVGHKGRIGIFELVTLNDAMRALISHNPSIDDIRAQAKRDGTVSLLYDGFEKVKQGDISLHELLRVVT